MKVTQVHSILSDIVQELTGKTDVVLEDLSNIVDVGKTIFDQTSVDNYVKKLVNRIGKTDFENRVYSGTGSSILKDSWEFGSILQRVAMELPEAQENKSWELTDGTSYDQDVFHQPKVSAKFFNSKTTFEIAVSFTEKQVKESFNSATELNSFLSMISTTVQNALTVSMDALIERTINNMIGVTLAKGIGTGTAGAITIDLKKTSPIAVNLLKLYNDSVPTAQTVKKANALTDFHFLRFAVATINQYQSRLTKISELFNIEATKKFTPLSNQILLVHADFKSSADVIVQSDMQNPSFTGLSSNAEIMPYWQGTGKDYGFASTSSINVKTSTGETIKADGIVAVLADDRALGVSNLDQRVTTATNARAEFYTNWYKNDCGFFNDLAQNGVVFFIGADA